jgi:hypothetical protein
VSGIGTFYLQEVPKGAFYLGGRKISEYDETVNIKFKVSHGLVNHIKRIFKSKIVPDMLKAQGAIDDKRDDGQVAENREVPLGNEGS